MPVPNEDQLPKYLEQLQKTAKSILAEDMTTEQRIRLLFAMRTRLTLAERVVNALINIALEELRVEGETEINKL